MKKEGGGGAAGKVSKWKKMLSQPEEKVQTSPTLGTAKSGAGSGNAKANISQL